MVSRVNGKVADMVDRGWQVAGNVAGRMAGMGLGGWQGDWQWQGGWQVAERIKTFVLCMVCMCVG